MRNILEYIAELNSMGFVVAIYSDKSKAIWTVHLSEKDDGGIVYKSADNSNLEELLQNLKTSRIEGDKEGEEERSQDENMEKS